MVVGGHKYRIYLLRHLDQKLASSNSFKSIFSTEFPSPCFVFISVLYHKIHMIFSSVPFESADNTAFLKTLLQYYPQDFLPSCQHPFCKRWCYYRPSPAWWGIGKAFCINWVTKWNRVLSTRDCLPFIDPIKHLVVTLKENVKLSSFFQWQYLFH